MKYRIGEVSKFLNLSVQMIRYYEKCGVIEPTREGDGQYRYYTDMDVFQLFDAMRYKEWNINIKDIKKIIEDNYFERLLAEINSFKTFLKDDMSYKSLLYSRMENVAEQLSLSRYNIGNYWIEEAYSQCWVYCGAACGDNYGILKEQVNFPYTVYEPDKISFFDILVEFSEESFTDEKEHWWYSIEARYYSALNLTIECKKVPKQYCACTIFDMGEVGNFNAACVEPLISYVRKSRFEQAGTPYGIILGRGNENGKFCRLMKIYIPLKTL